MKLKSTHLVLLGIILQASLGFLFIQPFFKEPGGFGAVIATIFIGAIGLVLLLSAVIGIIPLILLHFRKTKMLGAVISIIFGLLGMAIRVGFIIGFFLVIAGIYALWKERDRLPWS